MSTTSFESGANVPSAFNVRTPSTPFEVRTASVSMRFTARCSSTRTVASPLNGVAVKRTPPAGTGAVGDAAACAGVVAAGAATGAGAEGGAKVVEHLHRGARRSRAVRGRQPEHEHRDRGVAESDAAAADGPREIGDLDGDARHREHREHA